MGDVGTQIIQVGISGGVKTGEDRKGVEMPGLLQAYNVSWDTDALARKRYGFSSVGNADPLLLSSLPDCKRLAGLGNELLAFDGHYLWSRDAGNNQLNRKDATPELTVTGRRTVARAPYNIVRGDVALATTTNIAVCAWETTANDIATSIIDMTTGNVIRMDLPINFVPATRPRCVAVGNYIYVFYAETGGPTNLRYRRIDTTATNLFQAEQVFAADYSVGINAYDVDGIDSTHFVVAYGRAASVAIVKSDTTGATATTSIAEVAVGPIGLRCANGTSWVGYKNNGTGALRAVGTLQSSNAVQFGPVTLHAAAATPYAIKIGAASATTANYAWDNVPGVASRIVSNAGAFPATERAWQAEHIESGFFESDGRTYIVLAQSSQIQGSSFVCDLTDDLGAVVGLRGVRVVASLAQRVSGAQTLTAGGTVTRFVRTTSSTEFIALMPVKYKVTVSGGGLFTYVSPQIGLDLFTVQAASPSRFVSAEIGQALHIASGAPHLYDGNNVHEMGFLMFPEVPPTVTPAGAGGAMATGNYQYCLTARYTDFAGKVHRSNPSLPVTAAVVGPTGQVTLSANKYLPFTQRQDTNTFKPRITFEVWRTALNSSGPFYLVSLVGGTQPPIVNDSTSAGTWSYVDKLADGSVSSNETLYTSQGQLGNFPPPPSSFMFVHKNVILCDNAEDGSIWQSKPVTIGEGVAFHEGLSFRLPSQEKPVGGCSFEDKAVIFTRSQAFVLLGEPIDDKGATGGFTVQALPTDIGLIDPRAVVVGQDGAYFVSGKGIWLLTRALQFVNVGDDVSYFTKNYSTCMFACLVYDQNEIRIGMTDATLVGADSYAVLKLNYARRDEQNPYGKWSHDLYSFLADPTTATVVNGVYYVGLKPAPTDSSLFKQDKTTFFDAGNFSPMVIGGIFRPNGMQGYVRARRLVFLAERKSMHALEVDLSYNYSTSIQTVKTWANVELAALPQEQVDVLLELQKIESVEFTIYDTEDTVGAGTNTGEGFTLSAVALEVGVKKGTYRNAMVAGAHK